MFTPPHRRCLPLLLAFAAGCQEEPSTEPQPPSERPVYSAATLYQNVSIGMANQNGYAYSPDGTKILISSDESGIFNIYAIDLDDGNATQLSHSTDNAVIAISFFPGDRRVLATSDTGGNERTHLFVRSLDGAMTDITPGDDVRARFLRWEDGGDAFYAMTNEIDPSQMDIYRFDTTTLERSLVYRNESTLSIALVSPDGQLAVAQKEHSSADNDLIVIDLQSEDPTPRIATPHDGDVNHSAQTISPDSKTLIYTTDENGEFDEAWSYDLASGERSPYLTAEWDLVALDFSPSAKYRVWAVNADAHTEVHLDDLDQGREVSLRDLPPGDLSGIRFSRDESSIVLTVSSDTSPRNAYLVDLASGSAKRLTDTATDQVDESQLVRSQIVRYPSFDRMQIPAVLYRPHGASAEHPVPALVWVHGGPGGQSRQGYNPTIQHLVNHGYAVLAANNRGSSGYGKTFYHLDDKRHGTEDLDDIVYGGRYLASQNWVDGDRIGIIGASYGGYMVAAALAFRPDDFKVGIDIFGVTNWVRTLKQIPAWWADARNSLYDELGDPSTDEERLRMISPLFHANNINKPLLVIQGANDPRVLQVESDELVAIVRNNGTPVKYIVFPDEGHGFRRRDNRITASDAYVEFLDTHL